VIPEALQQIPPTNVGRQPRFYDQIALRLGANNFIPKGHGGVFDYFAVVYLCKSSAKMAQIWGRR
jgi:hypothetical protein